MSRDLNPQQDISAAAAETKLCFCPNAAGTRRVPPRWHRSGRSHHRSPRPARRANPAPVSAAAAHTAAGRGCYPSPAAGWIGVQIGVTAQMNSGDLVHDLETHRLPSGQTGPPPRHEHGDHPIRGRPGRRWDGRDGIGVARHEAVGRVSKEPQMRLHLAQLSVIAVLLWSHGADCLIASTGGTGCPLASNPRICMPDDDAYQRCCA